MTRLVVAAAVFLFFALWEFLLPRRPYHAARLPRWAANLALQSLNALFVMAAFVAPALSLGALAEWAEMRRVGLLNLTHWSFPLKFALTFMLLDLAVWAQHWLFHVVPGFWLFHRVHHTDVDLDVTTGLRFHPFEYIVSALWKAVVVLLLGAHFLAVFVFELALNAASLFTHANLRIPFGLEPRLRLLFVTPDMHRIHHSVRLSECDSNFGFCLSLWDRLAGTYEPEAADGPTTMGLGLPEYRDAGKQTLWWLVKLPLLK